MQKHREVTKDHKRPQKATKGHHGYKCHHEMTSISTKYLLENAEVTKNKNDQSNPKMEAKHWSLQCHWLPATGFRRFKIQILIKFTVRPSHVQSQNHLQKEWSNSPKAHTWSRAFCCSGFNVQMHNPCYMTHRVLKARMNYCINQNLGQKITSKPNTEALQCH